MKAKKLTIAQIKEIERIRKPCKKGICGWCVLSKKRIETKTKLIFGAWCPFFEKFIRDLKEGEDWRETKRLPECIAACKGKAK